MSVRVRRSVVVMGAHGAVADGPVAVLVIADRAHRRDYGGRPAGAVLRRPTVVIPQMNEQRATALRVEELGLGRHLSKGDATVAGLRAAVAHVATDSEIATNLSAMRQRIHAVDGPSTAADAIEKHLPEPIPCRPGRQATFPGRGASTERGGSGTGPG
jgi:hypothetical protein